MKEKASACCVRNDGESRRGEGAEGHDVSCPYKRTGRSGTLGGGHGDVEAEGDVVAEFGPGGVGADFDGFELGGPLLGDLKAGSRELKVEKLKVESWEGEKRIPHFVRDDNSFFGGRGSDE